MGCKERNRRWVKVFGLIFAVLVAFGFFSVLFYFNEMRLKEERRTGENITGEHFKTSYANMQ